MSAIFASIFKSTVVLLVNKAREKTADKLKDGDVADEAFRNMIVSKIDDIKSKLDGHVKKDLLASIKFLKSGIVNLNQVFEKTFCIAGEDNETTAARVCVGNSLEDGGVTDGSKQAASLVTKRIRNLQLTVLNESAKKSLGDAEKRFEDARKMATIAFSSAALTTSDRILALKIQLMATILERVDRPADVLEDCRLCLEDLHDMKAVRENFRVLLSGGMKSHLNKDEREAIIVAVCQVNHVVFRVKQLVDGGRSDTITLPCLTAGGERLDVLRDERVVKKLLRLNVAELCVGFWSLGQKEEGEQKLKQPCCLATNTRGQFIVADNSSSRGIKVYSSGGKFEEFIRLDFEVLAVHALATDKDDNVYVLADEGSNSNSFRPETPTHRRGLYVFGEHESKPRKFTLKEWFIGTSVTVNDNNQVFVLGGNILGIKFYVEVYATGGEHIRSFGHEILKHPNDITAAHDGRVFVLMDLAESPRVHTFSAEGDHLRCFPLRGGWCSGGSLALGWGAQTVVVSLWGRDCTEKEKLSIYTGEGEFVRDILVFDNETAETAGYKTAQDVAVTVDGRIAVITWTTKGTFCKIGQEISVG